MKNQNNRLNSSMIFHIRSGQELRFTEVFFATDRKRHICNKSFLKRTEILVNTIHRKWMQSKRKKGKKERNRANAMQIVLRNTAWKNSLKRIVNQNQFRRCLEIASFQFLKERRSRNYYCHYNPWPYFIFGTCETLSFQWRPSKFSLLCILLNKYGTLNKPQTIIHCTSSKELARSLRLSAF